MAPVPNVERPCETGTMFSDCSAAKTLCAPARATLATGLPTRRQGVFDNNDWLDPASPTFMRIREPNGWLTGSINKFHFEPFSRSLHGDYRTYGFDERHGANDACGGEWID